MKRKTHTLLVHWQTFVIRAGLGVAALAFAPTASADLIVNGDFSVEVPFNGTGGGWTSSGMTPGGGWAASGGNPDGQFTPNGIGSPNSDPTIQQTVSGLTIGDEYRLTWDYRLHFAGGPNGNSFGVFLDTQTDPSMLDNSNSLFIGENLSFSSYLTESVDFIATSTTHTLFFSGELDDRTNGGFGTSDVSYNVDNVSLVSAVPEPAMTGVLAIFLVGGFLKRRRR